MNYDPKNKPDFAVWKQETLVKFAGEAYDALHVQEELIEELQHNVKIALGEVRRLVIKEL